MHIRMISFILVAFGRYDHFSPSVFYYDIICTKNPCFGEVLTVLIFEIR